MMDLMQTSRAIMVGRTCWKTSSKNRLNDLCNLRNAPVAEGEGRTGRESESRRL